MKVRCTYCQAAMIVPDEDVGRTISCPLCHGEFLAANPINKKVLLWASILAALILMVIVLCAGSFLLYVFTRKKPAKARETACALFRSPAPTVGIDPRQNSARD